MAVQLVQARLHRRRRASAVDLERPQRGVQLLCTPNELYRMVVLISTTDPAGKSSLCVSYLHPRREVSTTL